MSKIYAIGDIHGEITKLNKLISIIPYKDGDTVVFLGDYIDRGENPYEVINSLIELKDNWNCVFLIGNHEQMFMDYLRGYKQDLYLYNGGVQTLKSYNVDSNEQLNFKLPEEHELFFKNLKLYHETKNYIFVHAGLWIVKQPLSLITDDILLWIRNEFINCDTDYGKKVIFGHTPLNEPLVMNNKIGIDTGAFMNDGKLTCIVLPDETFIQV